MLIHLLLSRIVQLFIAFIFICFLIASPITSRAEEERDTDAPSGSKISKSNAEQSTTEPEPINSTNSSRPKPLSEKARKRSSPKIFKPSEEISEDLSVPFPVDI